MTFKVKKICKGKSKIKNKVWRRLVRTFGSKKAFFYVLFFTISVVLLLGAVILNAGIFTDKVRQLVSVGPLKKGEFGHTNILLLGVAGKNEEGGNLSDSILILSINPKNPSASFLSLPRDLFIESGIGDRKINEIYAAARYKYKNDRKGLEVMKKALSDFTGVKIHYGAVINFQVFEDFVDELGGIDMFVSKEIVDPFYPDEHYGYKTFIVRKGLQTLDGAAALQYARSRKTSSDYDRAQRQQDLLLAIRKKVADLNLLTDFDKLRTFYNIFKQNINTDLGIVEIVELAKLAVSINYQNSISAVLNDDPTQKGGFLYTPAREFYGGQFVLLPKNLRDTQKFIELVLVQPEILLENMQFSILNGSKISGYANKMATRLRRFGFHVIDIGNYESSRPIFRSFFYDYAEEKALGSKNFLKEFLDIKEMSSLQESEVFNEDKLVDLQIILGTN
ncbi:LCP family protein [Candidatus Gracilibacteria bacterium]|nr:LCP family protein [Candidatus Gracilibacteria bacterium]